MPRKKIQGICSVDGCNDPIRTLGLCNNHYQRQYKYGRLHKIFTGEKRRHPLYVMWHERKRAGVLVSEWLDFWVFVRDVGSRPSARHVLIRILDEPWGPANFKWQETLRRGANESQKAWHARKWASRRTHFPLYEADRGLRRKYGINLKRYEEMLEAQNNQCAICDKPETAIDLRTSGIRRLAVDHCHKTKRVRGLLCFRCNTVIGKIDESLDLAKAVFRYLEKYKGEN